MISFDNVINTVKNNRVYINYSRMWPYVKPVWFRALCSMLICIPIDSLDAVIALALKPYMDLVMVEKSIASPWYIPLGIVAFTSIQGGLKYLSAYLSTWVGGKITNGLKFDMIKKLLTLLTSFFDKQNSGGGKTTIVNLLPRFYDIKSGSISIDGIDIRDYTLESLRQNIAVVFQDNFLFSGTIRDNILLGNENATEEQINQAVKMAYLDEFIASLQEGLDTQIGERGILLSGGQKQRVTIARAFLKDAPIIILDEATSALDNKAEAVVQKAIDNLMKDKTVFVIAHRLSTIRNADKIAVINEGELVELGNHDELMSIENGQYKALYEMQFKKQKVTV